jgi:hypothetical protein
MKKNILTVLLSLFIITTFSQTNPDPGSVYDTDTIHEDYLTIIYTGFFIDTDKAYISINGEEHETITLTSKGLYNYNEALKLMKKYNEQGWVLRCSNISFKENSDYFFVLMSRRKVKTKSIPDKKENLP